MHASLARLGPPQIQLELEFFQLDSAFDIFEPACLAMIGQIRAKIGSVLAMKRNRLGPKNANIIVTPILHKSTIYISFSFEKFQEIKL